jgi:LysR family hydrogen peroxide-inducible transcriptional activator
MEMNQISYFIKAGETLNFTRAAEQCGVSVPSLSRGIRQLEEELGGQLFRRERHLTHLTDLGRLMLEHFSIMSRAADAAKRDAKDYASLVGTRLKLGVFASIGADVLTGYLATLRDQARELELHIWEANCEELEGALLGGEIDIALTSSPDLDERIRMTPLFREAFYISFAPGHRFGQMNAVPMRELDGEDYVKRLHCEFPSNLARLGVAKPYKAVNVRYVGEREDWIQSLVRPASVALLCLRTCRYCPGWKCARSSTRKCFGRSAWQRLPAGRTVRQLRRRSQPRNAMVGLAAASARPGPRPESVVAGVTQRLMSC